jgi:hypothetical protein
MNVPVFDAPLLLLLGIVWGYIYAKKLVENHPDSHSFFRHILMLIFFLNIILSAIGVIQPWGMGGRFAVVVNPWIGVFYVLSYPMWFWFGNEVFFLLWGKNPQEGGLTWLLTIKDTTKPFKPAWKSFDKPR